MLGVTYKTAWFMMHRVREAMKDDGSPLGGPGMTVESDEAFVGGFKKKRLSGKVADWAKQHPLGRGQAPGGSLANLLLGTPDSQQPTNEESPQTPQEPEE
jgi:hypothetical protein